MKDPRFAEHLAVFAEVVRQGSFSAAARRRGQTPSAIVRQIDALEHSLGVPLLEAVMDLASGLIHSSLDEHLPQAVPV